MEDFSDDEYDEDGNPAAFCRTCGGDGWGTVGIDWPCDDFVNGPYEGEAARCPNCLGSGKAEDMRFW